MMLSTGSDGIALFMSRPTSYVLDSQIVHVILSQ
jgi:hypothetical protein